LAGHAFGSRIRSETGLRQASPLIKARTFVLALPE
jgi:hypothetical protein